MAGAPEHEETGEYQGFEAVDIVVRRTVTIYDRGYVGRYYLDMLLQSRRRGSLRSPYSPCWLTEVEE